MGLNRRTLIQFSLFAAFSCLLGFSYSYHLPRLETFLLVELEKISQTHLPVRIWARKLNFHLFPLGIVLEDVRLLPKKPLDRYLAPTRLKEIGARVAVWPLLRGDVRLSQIFVRDSQVNVFLRPELFEKSDESALKVDFDQIYNLPINELLFENVVIQGRVEPQNVFFRASDVNLLVENRYRSLFIDLEAPKTIVKPSGPIDPLNVQIELRTLLEAEEMQISALKIRADESFLVASGRCNGDLSVGRVDNGAFDARAKIQLPDLNLWESIFASSPRLPPLQGQTEFDIGLEIRNGQAVRVETDLNAQDLHVDRFTIGAVQGRFNSDLKSLHTDKVRWRNQAGEIQFRDLKVEFSPHPSFTTGVNMNEVDLHSFLANLNVNRVPVELPVSGDATCKGAWGENPEAHCQATIQAPRLRVHTDPENKTIVATERLKARGDVRVTATSVDYRAELEIGARSRGRSQGVISYQKGFQIQYEGDEVHFTDVKDLAGLKFEGGLQVKGRTDGTSKWATLEMNVAAKNLWLEDYPLGQLTSKVRYKSGHLFFDSAQGQYEVTRYNGNLDVDLREDRMKLALQIPFVDLRDIQSLFQRKITLPFQIAGTGTGQIEAEGPFNFRRLSYVVRSKFFRGQIAEESFDELTFNVKSTDGMVQSERIFLTKASGVMEAKGQVNPAGDVDAVVVARGLRLEQSENVLALGFDLQGQADFTLLIRGALPRPRVELNGRLSRVVLGDQPADDSVFKLNFLSDRMEGSGQFLGTTLVSEFTFPYTGEAPFLFKLKTHQWDFTNIFSLVSQSARQLDFTTSVSMDVNIQSPTGGFWNSSGQVQVNQFVIRKGARSMSASKPMYLSFREGVINSNGFAIGSGDSYLKLDVVNLRRDALNASLNGKLDLSLLGLFTPFISDLRGAMSISMDLGGRFPNPNLSGSAYVDKGYAKFVDFQHPFSNVRADLLFNDNQILLNAVRGDLGGGKFSGQGRITFAGQNTHPVDVRGTVTDVKLNIPEGFRTRGSGSVAISGERFPYTMNIQYDVSGGEVVYEFGGSDSDSSNVKASIYLPQFLYRDAFHPFTFDVKVNLLNPVLINNALVHSPVSGKLSATGTPDRLLLDGTLTPQPGGKVFFHDVPFEIATAFVDYNRSPPNAPKIYLTANTRVSESVQDDQGRVTEHHYDVNLLVQGRGPNPQIILSSQPPLSQRELVSLLALGVTPSGLDEGRSSEFQAANTSTALGAALLQKAGSRRLKDSIGLDVKVTSSQPTPETASTPKVTLSKQWTPKFGASASSTLQANPSNNVKVEYKMNKNISVIGSWDGREYTPETKDTNQNVFGLDLEYKVQFK
ncbi:MAG: translocation/assembly module TamB domain-containing protein [Bdellovibrionales bacterium]